MAASGYKLFVTGDVLTAAQVNDYLMLQTVMVFANSAARTSALSGVLAEGLVSYLKDTDVVEIYTGAAWVSLDDPNAIQNSIVTAKGDLIGATASGTPSRVAAGNNGETLVADSSTSTGLRYQAPVQQNPVLNSAMQVWQRNTSFTNPTSPATALCADRWVAYRSGWATNLTTSRQTSGLTDIQYSIRLARNSGDTSAAQIFLGQNFESVNSIPFAGKTVTMSFYAKAGANFSSSGNLLTVQLYTGTGTDQNIITGLTGTATPISVTQAITTSWVRYSFTGTVASNVTQVVPYLNYTPSGTAGANDWFEVTGVQMEVGSVATPFKTYAATIQGELAACKRYLPSYDNTSGTNNGFVSGYAYGTNSSIFIVPFDVAARVSPTGVTVSGTMNAYALNVNTAVTPTFDAGGINSAGILASHTITAGQGARLGITSGAKLLFTGCEL